MIKNLPEFNSIQTMSNDDLVALKTYLEDELNKRKNNLPKYINKYENISKKYAIPKNALEASEVTLAKNKVVNTKVEISILEAYIKEINEKLDLSKTFDGIVIQVQPGE